MYTYPFLELLSPLFRKRRCGSDLNSDCAGYGPSAEFRRKEGIPFIIASGFIADTTSLPLVVSNLVNIVSADFFGITFTEYASRMLVPNLFSLASVLVLYLFFRKSIPRKFDDTQLKHPSTAIQDPAMFRLSWIVLSVLLIGYFVCEFVGIPVSIVAGVIAIFFLLMARKVRLCKQRKYSRCSLGHRVFSIGMYVVVYSLRNAGLTDLLASVIQSIADQGLFAATMGMGFIAR